MQAKHNLQYKLADLINSLDDGLDVILKGDGDCLISGVATIQQAKPGQITFLANPSYKKYLSMTQASAVILSSKESELCSTGAIISSNPYFVYAKIAAFFAQEQFANYGIHPTASCSPSANIADSASIGANVVIGNYVNIADHVTIGPGCVLGDYVEIGEHTVLSANVTLGHKVKIGKRTSIASGAVIGSDGFGFANQNNKWHKVPQLGSVSIGDDVDIGANTTIDRGAMEDTVIENGVKLDNLIQVGHNVQIGENTIIAGCTAIAGSTIIGKNCMIGGSVCFAGHMTIQDHVMITGMTAVTKSIRESGIYSSGIVGAVPNHEFRKNNARFHRLENLMQKVKKLETEFKALVESKQS